MTTPEGASAVLLKARDLLAGTNWVQGAFEALHPYKPEVHGYCAIGALRAACPDPVQRYIAEARLAHVIRSHSGPLPSMAWAAVAVWNDSPYRTKEQVLRAFEEAAR